MVFLDKVINMCCTDGPFSKLFNPGKADDEGATMAKPPMSKPSSKFSNKEAKFLNMKFSKLPIKMKKAAETLGFTEKTWDEECWPESGEEWFEDLSSEKRQAAETLGWDVVSWDEKYENKDFDDLPKRVQDAAKLAGFTKDMWDDDEWPSQLDKHWEDLSANDRLAMNVLGYHRWVWD